MADVVIQMDADFSHDPADAGRLVARVTADADVAIGSRYVPGGAVDESWGFRRRQLSLWGNRLARWIAGLKGVRDCTAGFKAIRTTALRAAKVEEITVLGYAFQVALLHRLLHSGARVVEEPIYFRDRERGDVLPLRHRPQPAGPRRAPQPRQRLSEVEPAGGGPCRLSRRGATAPGRLQALVRRSGWRCITRAGSTRPSWPNLRALERCPRYAAALSDYGELLLDRQRYEDVLQLSRTAVEVDPYNATAWANQGRALFHLGRTDQALQSLDRALAIDPGPAAGAGGPRAGAAGLVAGSTVDGNGETRCSRVAESKHFLPALLFAPVLLRQPPRVV